LSFSENSSYGKKVRQWINWYFRCNPYGLWRRTPYSLKIWKWYYHISLPRFLLRTLSWISLGISNWYEYEGHLNLISRALKPPLGFLITYIFMDVVFASFFFFGLHRKLASIFFFLTMCLVSKECFENHYAYLRSRGWGICFFLNFSIWENEKMSISTRKWCPMRWNSNFLMTYLTTKISLHIEW